MQTTSSTCQSGSSTALMFLFVSFKSAMVDAFTCSLRCISCLRAWWEGWHFSLEKEVKVLCQRGEEWVVVKEKGGIGWCVGVDSKSAGRVVSRMEGINHYWRTPSSPTHPDGPSTPDINHHSPTIDPLSLLCRGKSVLVVLIFPFSPSAFPVSPPPSTSQPHCCVIMNHNWSEIHRILNKVYEGTLLYSPPRSSPPPSSLSIDAWEVSMERGKKGGKNNAIKITKHAQCYYTCIDLFLKHT